MASNPTPQGANAFGPPAVYQDAPQVPPRPSGLHIPPGMTSLPSPITPLGPSSQTFSFPPVQGAPLQGRPQQRPGQGISSQGAYDMPLQNMYDDAPPSYEDAIAADMPPIDGPRPDYRPPPAPAGEGGFGDTKRRGSS